MNNSCVLHKRMWKCYWNTFSLSLSKLQLSRPPSFRSLNYYGRSSEKCGLKLGVYIKTAGGDRAHSTLYFPAIFGIFVTFNFRKARARALLQHFI